MPSNDNRKLTSGIAVSAAAPPKSGTLGGKKVTHVQRVMTEADPFDEIECHLTPERVEELQEPDPVTGVPVLVGDWKGRATREEYTDPKDGRTKVRVVPAAYKPKGKAADDAGFDAMTADDLKALCDEHGCEIEGRATKAKMIEALTAKGVKAE